MKIAVIIVGKIKYNIDEINNSIRCYNLNNENTDIFIYNNSDINTNNLLVNHIGKNKVKYVNTVLDSDDEKICNKLSNTCNNTIINNFKKFYDLCIKENILNNNNVSQHAPFKNQNFFKPSKRAFQQYFQLMLALTEIEKYENLNNIKYDFIMKIRLDFYLKHDNFGPNHYFSDKNDILLKSYINLKKYYDKIDEEDNYFNYEYRINNYLFWRTTKFLGGQFILNNTSYDQIKYNLNNRDNFNKIIKDKFVITINDACFFSNGDNFKTFVKNLFNKYGEFYREDIKFWWTAEAQLHQSILYSNIYYFDYLQNNNYYKGREMWVNDYHGCEKYNKEDMKTN